MMMMMNYKSTNKKNLENTDSNSNKFHEEAKDNLQTKLQGKNKINRIVIRIVIISSIK
jgi:hypothetical protein